MRFPTGGTAHEPVAALSAGHDSVRLRGRQYSLDRRRYQNAGSAYGFACGRIALDCCHIPELFCAGAYIKAVCFAAWPRAAAGEEESFLPGHGKLRCGFPVNTFVADTGL